MNDAVGASGRSTPRAGAHGLAAALLTWAVAAACPPGARGGEGAIYVEAYNELTRMVIDRCRASGYPTDGLAIKNGAVPSGGTVVQTDLNVLRTKLCLLMERRFCLPPELADLGAAAAEDAFPFGRRPGVTSPCIMQGIGNGYRFTKVPGDCTTSGQGVFADDFTDVPLLWIHFDEIRRAALALRYTRVDTPWTANGEQNAKDGGLAGYQSSWDRAKEVAGEFFDTCTPQIVDRGPYAETGGTLSTAYKGYVHRRYGYQQVTGLLATNATVSFYVRAAATHGGQWDDYGDGAFMERDRWCLWKMMASSGRATVTSPRFGSLTRPDPWCDKPATVNAWQWRGYYLEGTAALIDWSDLYSPTITPPLLHDDERDGLTGDGCECPGCTAEVELDWRAQWREPTAKFRLGLSRGLTTGGLRVKSYITEYHVLGQPLQMYSLDTKVTSKPAKDSEGWKFAVIKRPSGAEVVFSLRGKCAGKAVNMTQRYRLKEVGSEFELEFVVDPVVHRFDAGGLICQVRRRKDGQEVILTGTPDAWPDLTVTRNAAKQVAHVVSGGTIAVPVYGGSLAVDVTYKDRVTSQTLVSGNVAPGSRIYRLFSATGEVLREARVLHDGDRVEVWRGVRQDGVASVARKEIVERRWVDSGAELDVTETAILHPDTPEEERHVTARVLRRFPWGMEVTEETAAAGTAVAQATTWAYYDDADDGDNYGNLRLRNDPDGGWMRYEDYDAEGRPRRVCSPFGNQPATAAAQACRATRYVYAGDPELAAAGFPADSAAAHDARPRLVVESIAGREVSRTFHAYPVDMGVTKRCAVPGARYDDASNLVTVVWYSTAANTLGRPGRIQHEDGTLSTYGYVFPGGGRLQVTAARGAGQGSTVTNGTLSVRVEDGQGRPLSERVSDIVSGVLVSHRTFLYDAWGRSIGTSNILAGTFDTTVYGCCGPELSVDEEGVQTAYSYNPLGEVESLTRDGVTRWTRHDVHGNTVETRLSGDGAADIVESASYDAAGRLVRAEDPTGARTAWSYADHGADGTSVELRTASGATRLEEYARDGELRRVSGAGTAPEVHVEGVDDEGRYTIVYAGADTNAPAWERTRYDLLGRVTRQERADGSGVTFRYDSSGRACAESDGFTTVLTAYDSRGEPFRRAIDMDANGRIDLAGADRVEETATRYAVIGGVAVVEQEQRVYPRAGDATPQATVVNRSAVSGATTWTIAYGRTNVTVVTRNRTQATRQEETTHPDGTRTRQRFIRGRLEEVSRFDAAGHVLASEVRQYDAFRRVHRRLLTAANGELRTETQLYNAAGAVTNATVAAGALSETTAFEYDGAGRQTRRILPDGEWQHVTYDVWDNVTESGGARTYPLSYGYDEVGRLASLSTAREGPTGPLDVTRWEYDARRGWVTAKVHPDGGRTRFTYRADGRLVRRAWARGVETAYAYDAAGSVTNVTYSDGSPATQMEYDRLGRAVRIRDAAGERAVSYGADGQVTAVDATGEGGDASRVAYAFDRIGRLAARTVNAPGPAAAATALFAYDDAGRLAQVADGVRSVTYGFAPGGGPVASARVHNGRTVYLEVERSFDGLDRLVGVTNRAPGGAVLGSWALAHNAAGQRAEAVLGDGSRWAYAYDVQGQLVSARRFFAPDAPGGGAGAPVPGAQFEYRYDTFGNRRSAVNRLGLLSPASTHTTGAGNVLARVTDAGRVAVSGEAEPDARVTVATGGANAKVAGRHGAYFWTVAGADNATGAARVESVVTTTLAQGTNSLVRTERRTAWVPKADVNPAYDADGNLLDDGLNRYTWDGENRLIAVETPVAERRCDFTYDAVGRRVGKVVSVWTNAAWQAVQTNRFVYDGWLPVYEKSVRGGSVTARSLAWGLDLSGSLAGAGGIGGLLWTHAAGGEPLTALYDFNGNVIALVTTNGTPVAEYAYGPFGEPLRATGPEAAANPWRFSTKHYDPDSGLYDYGLRHYSPRLARWLSPDPLGEEGGANLYEFVGNRPVQSVDPLGLAGYFFGGTGNSLAPEGISNVELLYRDWSLQKNGRAHYVPGVFSGYSPEGSAYGIWETMGLFSEGAAGRTLGPRVDVMMRRLERELDLGDHEVNVFGFSRGATSALEFLNRIQDKIRSGDARYRCVFVKLVVLWDMVKTTAYDYRAELPPDMRFVFPPLHFIAIDEQRSQFFNADVLNIEGALQVGFRGVHCDVGGGYDNSPYAWISRKEAIAAARIAGVHFDGTALTEQAESINWAATPTANDRFFYNDGTRRTFPSDMWLHPSVAAFNAYTTPRNPIAGHQYIGERDWEAWARTR